MAQFKNVSGVDRHLALPEYLAPRLVEAGSVVDVDDALAAKYDFNQAGVWEAVSTAPAAPAKTKTDGA